MNLRDLLRDGVRGLAAAWTDKEREQAAALLGVETWSENESNRSAQLLCDLRTVRHHASLTVKGHAQQLGALMRRILVLLLTDKTLGPKVAVDTAAEFFEDKMWSRIVSSVSTPVSNCGRKAKAWLAMTRLFAHEGVEPFMVSGRKRSKEETATETLFSRI